MGSEMESIKSDIYDHYKSSDFVITERIAERLGALIELMLNDGHISSRDGINKVFDRSDTIEFIKCRQPVCTTVDNSIIEGVRDYFDNELKSYIPVSINRSSNHPDDTNLYSVIAYNNSLGNYACWTCYNAARNSINYGHYNLGSYDAAKDIINEYFNDITDEIDRFGPDKSAVIISSKYINKVEEEHNDVSRGDFKVVSRKGR